MPFLDQTAQRQRLQQMTPLMEYKPEPTFGEVFEASVGLVFDEELSISAELNREGWRERERLIKEKLDNGEINRDDYLDHQGNFDHNRVAWHSGDPRIKSDRVLTEERNELLRKRREYATDIIERGSGMAQFLGSANAYMLDPVSISTMFMGGAAVTGARLSKLGSVLNATGRAAAIEAGAELFIQPLVYAHKQDIGSPYSAGDAITNIATAAVGAALFEGVPRGIGEWISSVRKKALPQADLPVEELSIMDEHLLRFEETVKAAPKVDLDEVERGFFTNLRTDLESKIESKLPRGEVKSLNSQAKKLAAKIDNLQKLPLDNTVKKQLTDAFEAATSINTKLQAHKIAQAAEKELVAVDSGILNKEITDRLTETKTRAIVENESKFLNEMEAKRTEYAQPASTVKNYDQPIPPPESKAKTTTREREILDYDGLGNDFDRTMNEFGKIENPVTIKNDEVVNAKEVIDEFDKELDGLESVLVCAYGK